RAGVPAGLRGRHERLVRRRPVRHDRAGRLGWGGITSAGGGYHAVVDDGDGSSGSETGPFTRFGGYSDTWTGGFTTSLDIYLDPTWAAGSGFDYSVAANNKLGEHLRDFIFHVAKDSSEGKLLVGGSNNSNFAPQQTHETINHYVVEDA